LLKGLALLDVVADIELGQRPLVTDRDISDNRREMYGLGLTFDGINAAIMIISSSSSSLPEKSSTPFDLMSWIGRGNVLTITVDMALLLEDIREISVGYHINIKG
jgi:hypothetical protein